MPMRPHCDRCDKLIDDSVREWVDDSAGMEHHIWHLRITGGAKDESLLCRACLVIILQLFLVHADKPVDDDIPF